MMMTTTTVWILLGLGKLLGYKSFSHGDLKQHKPRFHEECSKLLD